MEESGVREEDLVVHLSKTQAECLARALNLLFNGHSGRFEDELWLGFADGWWPLRQQLVKGGFVRCLGGLRDEMTITERGQDLIAQLEGKQRAAG
jgi:hypothetical protein